MSQRGVLFKTIEEHDAELVKRWNEVVGPKDTVWHLGDFAMGKDIAKRIRPQLNGSIHLVCGNHDEDNKIDRLKDLWAGVHKAHYLRLDGDRIYLHHYACMVWRKSNHGSFHLYGHSHGHLPHLGRAADVGVDVWDFQPVEWTVLREQLVNKPPVDHHGENAGKPGYYDGSTT